MGPLALGIDVGTSAVKVCMLDEADLFDVRAFGAERSNETRFEERLDPVTMTDWIWTGVREVLKETGWDERLAAVAVTAHGQSALLVSGRQPVGAMTPWWADIDSQILDQQAALLEALQESGESAVVLHPRGLWLPARLRQWAVENAAVVDAAATTTRNLLALQLKDLLNLQLTGVAASDPNSLRGWLDAAGEVPAGLAEWIGLADSRPPLGQPTETLGVVDAAGSEISGIPTGTPVAFGLDDFSAGLGGLADRTGGFGPFSPLLNLANTSEHLAVVVESPTSQVRADMRQRALDTGLTFLPADDAGTAVLYASTNSGGQTLLNTLPRLPGAPNSGDTGRERMSSIMMWVTQLMGDLPTTAEMVGVPEFTAEIHGRRGLAPDSRAIGGWSDMVDVVEAAPPRLLAWRIFDSLVDSLEPIRSALMPFIDAGRPVRIGGGLAMMTGVLESRAARWPMGIEVAAGAEVSALGAARVAREVMRSAEP